ncbi:hypothetical protein HAX54_012604 [Datura stramonium]|uniref:Uncharacterized protein n=1 Tax=Datura stramonium TaxID=4076 RepID=A0ABS8TK02_DATST|nr:hypothetical protein [Datura stramonium]
MSSSTPYLNRYTRMVGKGEARVKAGQMLEQYDSEAGPGPPHRQHPFGPSSLTLSLNSLDFENPFSGTPASTSFLPLEDSSIRALYVDPSNDPVNPITPQASTTGKA